MLLPYNFMLASLNCIHRLYSHENRLNILCDNVMVNIVKWLTREIKKLRHVAENHIFFFSIKLYLVLATMPYFHENVAVFYFPDQAITTKNIPFAFIQRQFLFLIKDCMLHFRIFYILHRCPFITTAIWCLINFTY